MACTRLISGSPFKGRSTATVREPRPMVISGLVIFITDWRMPSRQISSEYKSTIRGRTTVTSPSVVAPAPPVSSGAATATVAGADEDEVVAAGRTVTIVWPASVSSHTGCTRNSPLLSVPSTRSSIANDLVCSWTEPASSRARSESTWKSPCSSARRLSPCHSLSSSFER